jgi:L-alanine-DL-glutamate epimerase-like enolase superfamily enzyme
VVWKKDEVLLELFTDQGIVGIGPGTTRPYLQEVIKPLVIGKNPFDVERLTGGERQRDWAGVDVACWDIIGQALGLPVYKLLATDHDPDPRVQMYASGGVTWTYYDKGDGRPYGVDALIDEALTYKARGYNSFKFRTGTDWEEAGVTAKEMGDVCRKLRAAVGPDFRLMLEKKAWDIWTPEECLEIAPVIEELGFFWFEQPMGEFGEAQIPDYIKLKELLPTVMLSGGENWRYRQQAKPWMERGIVDIMQTDCYRIGVTENWHIARLAEYNGVKMVPHNWGGGLGTMCNLHLAAGVPNGLMCELFQGDNLLKDEIFVEPYVAQNGVITLTDKPGFGMEIVEDVGKKFPYLPGSATIANPRFPHAWERARARERARYQAVHGQHRS